METIPDQDFKEKIFEIDHILDQIHHYTNQGRAKVFYPSNKNNTALTPSVKKVYIDPYSTLESSSTKNSSTQVLKKDKTIQDVLATHRIFQGSSGIKYM